MCKGKQVLTPEPRFPYRTYTDICTLTVRATHEGVERAFYSSMNIYVKSFIFNHAKLFSVY